MGCASECLRGGKPGLNGRRHHSHHRNRVDDTIALERELLPTQTKLNNGPGPLKRATEQLSRNVRIKVVYKRRF